MSGLEDTDGLCGVIHRNATSSQQVRCKYEFGHEGPHSYEGTVEKTAVGDFYVHPVEPDTQLPKQRSALERSRMHGERHFFFNDHHFEVREKEDAPGLAIVLRCHRDGCGYEVISDSAVRDGVVVAETGIARVHPATALALDSLPEAERCKIPRWRIGPSCR
jgi:hypothetical protein